MSHQISFGGSVATAGFTALAGGGGAALAGGGGGAALAAVAPIALPLIAVISVGYFSMCKVCRKRAKVLGTSYCEIHQR